MQQQRQVLGLHQACAGDVPGKKASLLDIGVPVADAVQDQRGHVNRGQRSADAEVVDDLAKRLKGSPSQLDPKKFLRIHRSAIVKIDKIKELQPWFHGEYHVILENGKQLTLSRNYRANLQEAVGKQL